MISSVLVHGLGSKPHHGTKVDLPSIARFVPENIAKSEFIFTSQPAASGDIRSHYRMPRSISALI